MNRHSANAAQSSQHGSQRGRGEAQSPGALKPIGLALAAVVTGLGAPGQGQAVEAPRVSPPPPSPETARVHYIDPTNHPGFEEDPDMVLGPSEPVEPFADAPAKRQRDLFE
jgi:hypothetical protein